MRAGVHCTSALHDIIFRMIGWYNTIHCSPKDTLRVFMQNKLLLHLIVFQTLPIYNQKASEISNLILLAFSGLKPDQYMKLFNLYIRPI